jgi:hypothetical protein
MDHLLSSFSSTTYHLYLCIKVNNIEHKNVIYVIYLYVSLHLINWFYRVKLFLTLNFKIPQYNQLKKWVIANKHNPLIHYFPSMSTMSHNFSILGLSKGILDRSHKKDSTKLAWSQLICNSSSTFPLFLHFLYLLELKNKNSHTLRVPHSYLLT